MPFLGALSDSKKNVSFCGILLFIYPLFLRFFHPLLVLFWKTAKNQGLFQGFSIVKLRQRVWTVWVNRAFTPWVNRAFTTRVNRASTPWVNRASTPWVNRVFTPWVNRAFTRWVHWFSLSQWTGCHPKRGLFAHFPLLFSKKSRHFSKVKMQAQTIVLWLNDNSWTLDKPWGRAYGCNPNLWLFIHIHMMWLMGSKRINQI